MDALNALYVPSNSGKLVPLHAVADIEAGVGPLSVSHYGQLPAVTFSFILAPGVSLGEVTGRIDELARTKLPADITGSFTGSAQTFRESLVGLTLLLVITILVIYMVLAILYEHFIHPLTILTALPLAMVGALLTLLLFGEELNIFSFVGLILLVGLVKKNGILPSALGTGMGAESRRPLGVAVVGGLLFSQMLTRYITPAFYVAMEHLSDRLRRRGGILRGGASTAAAAECAAVRPAPRRRERMTSAIPSLTSSSISSRRFCSAAADAVDVPAGSIRSHIPRLLILNRSLHAFKTLYSKA